MNRAQMLQPIQLIYVSAATRPLEPAQLRDLLAVARKNNYSVKVTGVLAYHDQCFLQVWEGARVAVEAIYNRVSTDPRHQQVTTLLRQEIDRKEFEEWSLAYFDGKDDAERLAGFVKCLNALKQQTKGESAALNILSQFENGDWRNLLEQSRRAQVA
ncbi:BLUF domain-containing protein [Maritalea mediterranea]|uniref:BLUF domain-containing protein n=1 Tax=Maritalea mediterranea TaxID=2909667 RepID=A0ABS9E7V0_9HYPH|nr:BLUF domain-containing protein [Maritalea mediterranea]MCF4097845.1 BLUF domain-containing protein [Maritalea mediterranea]